MSGIYLHIPFCKQACTYCDFYFSTSTANKDAVIGAMRKEMDVRKEYLEEKSIDSIYFGGGTPSLLPYSDLEQLIEKLKEHFSFAPHAEITLEANPDDISRESLRQWRKLGINRLSIGLQSFKEEELTWMNRAHTAAESVSSVVMAQEEGFDNITIDLIYGSKFQDIKSWEDTLHRAIALNTQHISAYNLTIENKTALGVNYKKGKEPAVNDELSEAQFALMADVLRRAGFIHYEISNFAKEGFFAKHNSNYWLQKHYLGIGPAAHSFNGKSRQWNINNNNQYIKALGQDTSFFEREELSLNERYNEYVLTRLRTIWGCNLHDIKMLFGDELESHFKKTLVKEIQHLQENEGTYTLKSSSKFLADGVAAAFFI